MPNYAARQTAKNTGFGKNAANGGSAKLGSKAEKKRRGTVRLRRIAVEMPSALKRKVGFYALSASFYSKQPFTKYPVPAD